MGFFNIEDYAVPSAAQATVKGFSVETLHKLQCDACPLNHSGAKSPHMEPDGAKHPIVYMLGSAPSVQDDRRDRHFTGPAGAVLRRYLPDDWLLSLRWNFIVRTRQEGHSDPKPEAERTPQGKKPTAKDKKRPTGSAVLSPIAIECCRPSVVADIERTKPIAIFGFGSDVLAWATGESSIFLWSGRYLPVKIGNHTCWFFPMRDPLDVLDGRRFTPRGRDDYGSDEEFGFAFELKRAFKIVEKLPKPRVMTPDEAVADVTWVTGANGKADLIRIYDWFDRVWNLDACGFDYETNMLRPYRGKKSRILTASLADDKHAFAWAMRHRQTRFTEEQLTELENELEYFLRKSPVAKVSHGLHFEQEWSGVKLARRTVAKGVWEDTQSQAYILDERPKSHSLDFLCMWHYGMRIKDLSNVDRTKVDSYPIETVLKYNGIDAKFHLRAHRTQIPLLEREKLVEVYDEQLRRVRTQVLTQMRGVPLDQSVVTRLSGKYKSELDDIEAELKRLPIVRRFNESSGERFNPASDDDIKRAFALDGIKVEKTKKTELVKIEHALTDLVLDWRKINKQLSTYMEAVGPDSPNVYPDGCMHPIIATNKTRTWRTSSEDPNIQNWTKHGEGKVVRKQVKPRKGYKVVAIDFSGIQARNVAMESRDKMLTSVYWEGYDIHSAWRERILKFCPKIHKVVKRKLDGEDPAKFLRQMAKNKFVFPTFFGSQAKSLARDIGAECDVDFKESWAEDLLGEFFDEFPGIKAWHDDLNDMYWNKGYVTGLSGFRRRAPISPNQRINSPIQADESIIVCDAQDRLSQMGEEYTANLMIHDDLTWFWPENKMDEYIDVAVKAMCHRSYDWINVPLGVEVSVGDDWYSLKEIAAFEGTKDGGIRQIKK
jgi:DNA polymerase I-like protein with 3'-5' exonuclease and polymerase domains/uracil-DNA glycosylase